MVSFKVATNEVAVIAAIAQRASIEAGKMGIKYTAQDINMDVTATHANGCRLDLQKLLDAPAFDFLHDVFGIRQHLNRANGKLEDFFLPRCSAREEVRRGKGHTKA